MRVAGRRNDMKMRKIFGWAICLLLGVGLVGLIGLIVAVFMWKPMILLITIVGFICAISILFASFIFYEILFM
jgi:hypothetical protein